MDDTTNLCAQSVHDAVFAGVASGDGDQAATATMALATWTGGRDELAPPAAETETRPEVRWLRQERLTLEEDLDEALAALQQRHSGILALHYRCEKERVLAFQELNRRAALVDAERAVLAEREADLTRRATALGTRNAQLAAAQETMADLQAQAEALEQAARPRRQELEELRTLVAQAEAELTAVHQQAADLAEEIATKRSALEGEQTALAERRRQIDQRCRHLEKAEESLQRRLREWIEFENRSRAELEKAAEERAHTYARLTALANNPELRQLVTGWSVLPEHVRRTVLMLLAAP